MDKYSTVLECIFTGAAIDEILFKHQVVDLADSMLNK